MLPIKVIYCPYCGEAIELIIDDSLEKQEYIEDCSVCCRPIHLEVSVSDSHDIAISSRTDNET